MKNPIAAIEKAFTKLRRKRVSLQLFNACNGTVGYGPFKGLKLTGNSNTSKGNLGAKVTGMYEPEVMQKICKLGPFDDVVNFGAADGYFSIGMLVGNLATRSICFEMTQKGRDAVLQNARKNQVEKSTVVLGAANDTAGHLLDEVGFKSTRSLVLCDIEGAEFTVLSAKVLRDLKGATLIIELHDRLMDEGLSLRKQLIERLPESAKHEILLSAPPDWRGIQHIEALDDNDRALVCSDGRKMLGEWLVVTY